MRLLKCQTCRNTWLYTGGYTEFCTCSMCRTTVRLARATVAIRWDTNLPPTEGNTAVPFIDVYDRTLSLAFEVASEDGVHTRTIFVPPRVLNDLGLLQQDLIDAVLAAGGNTVRSGRYPISPAIRDRIQSAFD